MNLYIRQKNANESGKKYQVAECTTGKVVADFDTVGEAQCYVIREVVMGK